MTSRAPLSNSPGPDPRGSRARAPRAVDFRSIRFRLTAWHTIALAAVLLAFVAATSLFLDELTRDRSDRLLEATTLAFHHVFEEEYAHHRHLETAAAAAVGEFRFSGHRVQVYDDFGRLVADSDSAFRPTADDVEHSPAPVAYQSPALDRITSPGPMIVEGSLLHHLLAAAADRPALGTLTLAGEPVRASAITNRVGDRPVTLLVLQTEHPEDGVLRDFLKAIAIAIPISLLLAAAIGYALARKALMPVMAMGEQAARIGAESLHERLVVPTPHDELGRLATIFNGLLGRLELAFTQQRNFMAGASHDLRTPVAILRAEADVALARADRSAAEYRDSLEIIRQGTVELSTLVENLFTLARADAGDHPLTRSDFYLEELLSDCVRAARPLAQRRGITLHFSPDAEAPVRADELLLRRLIMNLLDNAIRHTPAGGRVEIELTVIVGDEVAPRVARPAATPAGERTPSPANPSTNAAMSRATGKPVYPPAPTHYRIVVSDTGSGIPPEARPFIFDRFYRADPARSRTGEGGGGGAGLGLPIARWIAEAHGGTLELEEREEDARKSSFMIDLPRE
jgi:signal transduction histidine kinase